MSHIVTMIPGDGVGPEIIEVAKACIAETGVDVQWDVQPAGMSAQQSRGALLPRQVIDSIRENRVALKGPLETPIGSGYRSVNVQLRKDLNLYACVRPCRYYPGIQTRIADPEAIDLVIIRENMEDMYTGIEFMEECGAETPLIDFLKQQQQGADLECDTGFSIKPISRRGSERVARFAFEYARAYGRKRISAVDKANIMKYSDGVFMRAAEKISADYPDIEFEHKLVDNMCMQLVQKPEQYEVLVMPNLYGDILSDLCAGLIGGLGVAPGANMGDSYAVFEPVHGTAPKYAGADRANPTAILLSSVLMLHHINESAAAQRLEKAVAAVIKEGIHVTRDLKSPDAAGQPTGTQAMGGAVRDKIQSL
ncbi:MAG: isocitrate/isopropylmalate dehydrogenase family protein [Desulfobacterales bacterium]|nr:isocitrate/isopropylmalate dehydrogenase family protein [Desulfobacterales bacterium]MBS3754911.1 isocitrate/isopropylmalate dehydrogenase family protein [Desulfobacterales bacterium]